jgi:hypothetical protein
MSLLLLPRIQLQTDPSLLEVFALGVSVLTLITLFHGSQLGYIVRTHRRLGKRSLENARPPWNASIHFGIAIVNVVVLHAIDVGVWAFVLYITGLIPDSHASVYFTASSYTTLGTLPVGHGWRDLSPMIAMSGLLTFAWTTAAMYNLLVFHHALVDELRDEFSRKMKMRSDLRKEMRDIRHDEARVERTMRAAERELEAGKGFLERWRLRRDESAKEREPRENARRDAEERRRKEREDEKGIYKPPEDKPKI